MAGLNLNWDRYHYRLGNAQWGDPDSPVRLEPSWEGPLPPLEESLAVAERAGCDIAPTGLEQQAERLRLRSYIWADQPERLARLEAAIAMARRQKIFVEQADAASWLLPRLSVPAPGRTTVVQHSIMWQYMPSAAEAAARDAIYRAGARASEAAPLAWLRFEPPSPDVRPELHLTLWPGERHELLATAHPHGTAVRWLRQ